MVTKRWPGLQRPGHADQSEPYPEDPAPWDQTHGTRPAGSRPWDQTRTVRPRRSDRLALHPAPFTLGQPAPDAEAFIMLQRVLQALHADLTAPADLLGLPGGATLLREESLRI